MKKWMLILLPMVVLASCHSDPKPIILTAQPSAEQNRKAQSDAPPAQSNIPKGTYKGQPCDTFKIKGGQNQIIAYQLRQDEVEKVKDNKERLKLTRQGDDFQFYFFSLAKEYSGKGISINNTYSCYINIFDNYFSTRDDRMGLIFIKADGTQKVLPGVHTLDEWKDEIRKFFNK